jgi:hypothetical protein
LWTDAVLLVQTLHSKKESILGIGEAGRVAEGDGSGRFGEDVLGRRVDERDEGAVAVHAQGAILRRGCQERTSGQRRRCGFATFSVDDVGGDVAGSKVSIAFTVVSGSKASVMRSRCHHWQSYLANARKRSHSCTESDAPCAGMTPPFLDIEFGTTVSSEVVV